ncbi:DUF2312 domain-containing protein [Rhizobium tropici]|uniref:GapR-like DNA-binding domain-containing protein n=1 Tax=Rhizobium tropici TaxID=398 RepID=A0A329YGC9_RHITR|nr:hypothetical protein DQ393_06180 [Rhizobium tropici]
MAKGEGRATGRNTVSGKMLQGFIERLERLAEEKKQITEDEKAVMAEMKAAGFSPKIVRLVIKRRAAKPADLEELEAELDMYLNALGMTTEAPLFRAVGMMNVDLAAREQVIDAFLQLVPMEGEIIVKVGKQPVRLWRDAKGKAHAEDIEDAPAPVVAPRPTPAARPPREVPDVDEAGAFELGQAAYHANEPITSNPFAWDDKRRPKFDAGWREASGSDGMGPET